ncbi:MAG TPA: CopG family transcriptional regulator [Xanthobacteraceae bacterium]|nr:CopG family transcriptional regulator [Xanthobacteraceae bacterium]
MRTTLTIDDDVAASLERLRKARGGSLKDLINEALRRGIKEMSARPKRREPFRTCAVDVGEVLIPLDNISEALAIAEGESFK